MSKYIGRPHLASNCETFDGKGDTWVAFGANLHSEFGSPSENCRLALRELIKQRIVPKSFSKLYQTPCFPAGAGPDYINFVAGFETDKSPKELLALLHDVEQKYGRRRDKRWAGRTLDIDILAVGDLVMPEADEVSAWMNLPIDIQMQEAPKDLLLPHPRIQDRGFVLIPFADVAPDWTHPILGKNVTEMLNDLPEAQKNGVTALDEPVLPLTEWQ